MRKPLIEMTPQELNSFLIEKYDFGLHPFSATLCMVLLNGGEWKDRETLVDIKEKLSNLKKRIIRILGDCENLLFGYPQLRRLYKKNKIEAEKIISKGYELEHLFAVINKYIEMIDHSLKHRRKGAPIKKQNFVASLWACIVKDIGYKVEWGFVADLLDWFWKILSPYKIYRELNPRGIEFDPEYLRIQYYRNKNSCLNYLKKLKMGHKYKNWPLSQITVFFGKNRMNLIHHLLLDAMNEEFSNNLEEYNSSLKTIIEKENELSSFRSSKLILAYEIYAIKLYRTEPISPPLIIFPDLSYLK